MQLTRSFILASSLSCLSLLAAAQDQLTSTSHAQQDANAQAPSPTSSTKKSIRLPTKKILLPAVQESILRPHLAYLSDDLLEGRGTGQRGGDLTVRYLETQAALIGLSSLFPQQAFPYRHPVQIVGSMTLPDSHIEFQMAGKTFAPQLGVEILIANSNGREHVAFDAPLVFVGYGVSAPEEDWDDYKGIDVKGKVVVMMVNDPQPTATEPKRFGGAAMTYYGRWVYKYEEAARRGAAGVLLIHTTASAAYGWNVPQASFSHERFSLAGGGNPMEGWWAEASIQSVFAEAGLNLNVMRAQAERRDFLPIPLPFQAKVQLRSVVRQVEQFNIVGVVPGTDPELKEQAIVYSSHWDHLGKVEQPGKPAQIWNGAVDNATGAAALLAMAQVAVQHPAKRSQIFLWPAAEEQGLIGSLAYVRNPAWPLAQTVADLNLDSMNFVGKTKDVGIAGSERSSLFESAKHVATQMNLKIAKSVPDLGGAYYRADHFNFARAGVPAFSVGSAVFSGDGHFEFSEHATSAERKMKAFKSDYHTVNDRYDAAWDLTGMLQQAQFTLNLGYLIANDKALPRWKKGDPYGLIKR
jgi:Zn-dependent M28 family amino/carboxypeptidase